MELTIYHNPRCSKSRATLELLRARGIEPNIVEYLKSPPSKEQLKTILRQLGIATIDLARRKEEAFTPGVRPRQPIAAGSHGH